MNTIKVPKFLIMIVTLFTIFHMATALVQHRLFAIGHGYITATALAYPLANLITDIVTEVYGYQVSRQMIWCGIIGWFVLGLLLFVIIKLPIPGFWVDYDQKFTIVISPYFRSVASDFLGIIIGQFVNIYIISKLKILLYGKYFWLRSVSSSFIGDIVTILIAIICIYIGTMPFAKVLTLAVYGIVWNIMYCAIAAVPAVFIVRILKRLENLDTYDVGINYNPFRFRLDN